MTLKTLCVCGVLVACGGTRAPEPLQPTDPVHVVADVGKIGKDLTVRVVVIISARGHDAFVSVQTDALLAGFGRVDTALADRVAEHLEAAAQSADARQSFSAAADKVSVTVSPDDWDIVLRLPPAAENAFFGGPTVSIDADNAPTLARLIRRANGNIAWLTPRLKELDLSRP